MGGSWSPIGDYLAVTQNEAHAWVEVWFPGYGWVPFDPTPPGRGETLGSTSWFWPGRFLFDAIQHRWNKWVLDYSFQTQFALFERSREVMAAAPASEEIPSSGGNRIPWMTLIWWILGGLALLWAGAWAFGRRHAFSQETRMYLRLRDSSRRAGVPPSALHSPLSLTNFLREAGHPAAGPSARVVDSYIQARFSGFLMREEEEEKMKEALDQALFSLRNTTLV